MRKTILYLHNSRIPIKFAKELQSKQHNSYEEKHIFNNHATHATISGKKRVVK